MLICSRVGVEDELDSSKSFADDNLLLLMRTGELIHSPQPFSLPPLILDMPNIIYHTRNLDY